METIRFIQNVEAVEKIKYYVMVVFFEKISRYHLYFSINSNSIL